MANQAQWRVGHQIAALGGMRLDGQAGAIPPHMFRRLINVRFSSGGMTERGGQHKLNSDALEGCITDILPGDAVPSTYEETLYTLSEDTSPSADPGTAEVLPWTLESGLGAGGNSGHLANLQSTPGADAEGAEETITYSTRTHGTISGDLSWSYEVEGNDPPQVQAVGASEGCCGGLAEHEDVWYEALVLVGFGTPLYQVYRVVPPGPTAHLDRQASGTPGGDSETRVWLAVYSATNELLAALEPSVLHRKSAAGVWSTVALPAGCTFNRNHLANWAEFEGLFYFTGYGPGGGHLLFVYDGAVVVAIHSWAGAPGTYSPVVTHDGSLYFGINAGGTIQLGRYADGAFSVVSTFAGSDEVRQLITAYGRLFAFRGDSLESSASPETTAFVVHDSTAGAYQAGAVRRAR
jgi:hypothetical protein